jgi:pSer/pThr/pTyr-binding forkhead associated (FHA) protein
MMLIVTKGDLAGAYVEIGAEPCVVGRDNGCNLRPCDLTVSRRHCEVWKEGNKIFVRDLCSTNGTLVNDGEVVLGELCSGDSLRLGSTVLSVMPVQEAANLLVQLSKITPVRQTSK